MFTNIAQLSLQKLKSQAILFAQSSTTPYDTVRHAPDPKDYTDGIFMRLAILFVCLFAASLYPQAGQCQPKVDPQHRYERLLAVVPMIGSGTQDDPKRPAFTPAPTKPGEERRGEAALEGIVAFTAEISDDGRFAIVEFVARDRSAFAPILEDKRPEVKAFEKGRAKREDMEREFRRYKADFDAARMGVILP